MSSMTDSILTSIKGLLGIGESDTTFDDVIAMHINTVLSRLYQMGVGASPFVITGSSETWTAFFGTRTDLAMIKTYVYLKVKLIFDPPESAALIKSMTELINEFEWSTNVAVDTE